MYEVVRVPVEVSGIPDGVELKSECSIARYRTKDSEVVSIKGKPRLHPCRIMASYTNGTMSVSVPETAFSVTVRLDEVMAVVKEAVEAGRNAEKEVDHGEECTAAQG